jgi:peptidoglycan/LPS O-acetylase OafA/YrhL
VLALHCNIGSKWTWPPGFFPFLNGYYGVVIFFTISGFLIMGNTLRRYGEPAAVDFREFYLMRAARILPPLLLFTAVALALGYLSIKPFRVPDTALLNSAAFAALTFQYNSYYLTVANVPGMIHWQPLWSLSIEEMFWLGALPCSSRSAAPS